jgi:putative inorganic carbon (HCO3(-)) transporter
LPLRGILLLLFFLPSIPLCFFRPFYGIILWIIVAFLNPQAYTWTAFDAFPWAAAVAVPTVLGMLVSDRKLERVASRDMMLLGVLWIWMTITTLISTNSTEFLHHAADSWERWRFVTKVLFMTVCMIPIVSSFERLRILMLTIAGCFGFYVLKSLPFVILTGGVYRLYGPERSMIADNNDFGLALNMTLPMYFYLAQSETRPWLKRLMAFLFVITLPAIFFTYSRGALVGLGATLLLMLLQSKRRLAIVPVVVMGLLIAVFLAPQAWQDRMDLRGDSVMDSSARSRLNAWAFSRALAADYPITGGGFATFTPELFAQYAPTMVLNTYGAHSVYFQVLAEHGYVGLTIYLGFVASALATARKVGRLAKRSGAREVGLYADMFQFSLVGFLVCGLFLGRAYFDYFFTVVACITILKHVAFERQPIPVPADSGTRAAPAFAGNPIINPAAAHGKASAGARS